jgi:hypothetical protein
MLPASMMPPAGTTGPASVPTQNPGVMADALSKVREAVRLLEMTLPGLQPGSDPHKAVLKAITDLSKIVPASAAPQGVQATTIAGLGADAQKTAMLRMLMGAMGGGAAAGGGGPPPGPMGGDGGGGAAPPMAA